MNEAVKISLIQRCNDRTGNIGIFIDFDNIFYSLKDYGVDPENEEYCIFSLMEQIYGMNKIRTMRAYADFDQVHVSFKKLQDKRVEIKNVYGNGLEEEYRKNASDIELSIDALEISQVHPDIDTFVFITSDSDMIPIMNRLLYRGKFIHLFCINDNTSHYHNMTRFCHVRCDLLTLFEIDPLRKNPEYWEDQALEEIASWYLRRKNDDMMLGGRWMNQLFCEKFQISAHAASRLIAHLKDTGLICEVISPAGYSGFQAVSA